MPKILIVSPEDYPASGTDQIAVRIFRKEVPGAALLSAPGR